MSGMQNFEDKRLRRAIRAAKQTLAEIEQQERNFYRMYGKHENDFLSDFKSVKLNEETESKKLIRRFDQLIASVTTHLKILVAKTATAAGNSLNLTEAMQKTTGKHASAVLKNDNEKALLSSSSIILSTKNDSMRLTEIEKEVKQLEKRIGNIEKRLREDIEAEEIGIEFPIAEIIDYVTSFKVSMYKRHLITHQFHAIVRNDERYSEEAKVIKKDYAMWTNEERDDLLTKMASLEDSLLRLEQFPMVRDDKFNKYFPLQNDLGFLKRLVARFLDKFEMNSSTLSLTKYSSTSVSQGEGKQKYSRKPSKLTNSQLKSSQDSKRKHNSNIASKKANKPKKALENVADSDPEAEEDDFQPVQSYPSQMDVHTAIEKCSNESVHKSSEK